MREDLTDRSPRQLAGMEHDLVAKLKRARRRLRGARTEYERAVVDVSVAWNRLRQVRTARRGEA